MGRYTGRVGGGIVRWVKGGLGAVLKSVWGVGARVRAAGREGRFGARGDTAGRQAARLAPATNSVWPLMAAERMAWLSSAQGSARPS